MCEKGDFYVFSNDESHKLMGFFEGRCKEVKEVNFFSLPVHVEKIKSLFDDYDALLAYSSILKISDVSIERFQMDSSLLDIAAFIRSDYVDSNYSLLISTLDEISEFEDAYIEFRSAVDSLCMNSFAGCGQSILKHKKSIDVVAKLVEQMPAIEDNSRCALIEAFKENGFVQWDAN